MVRPTFIMRYKEIYKKALLIDQFIDINRKSFNMPIKEIDVIIRYLFPSCYIRSKGWFKTVFRICAKDRTVVLKIGKKESIKTYEMMPSHMQKKHFAKIFWHTKYCLLQEYGEEANPTMEEVERLRAIGLKYGISDIRKENIRKFGDRLKIIDAKVTLPGSDKINFIKDLIRVKFSTKT